jgi:hypothetical protein
MASNITVDTLTKGSTTLNTDEIVDTNSSQVCKAWVNFNATGTVAIRDSYNVSSIIDNATGIHTVSFTNAMANASYSVATCNGDDRMTTTLHNTLVATGSFRLHSKSNANAFADSIIVMTQVFGD